MAQTLSLDTILSEFDEKSEAWVLQDEKSKKYLTIPDPRHPGRNPIRLFLRREDAEGLLQEVLEVNEHLRQKDIFATKVKLIQALKGIAGDKAPGHADSFVVHSPNEVYDWLRESE